MQIYDILMKDHRTVMDIIQSIIKTPDAKKRKHMFSLVHTELAMHARAEEEVFYNPLRERLRETNLIEESYDDHDEIDKLLAQLQASDAADAEWMAKLLKLQTVLRNHIATEEDDLFERARKLFSEEEAEEIGVDMLSEKGKLGMPNPFTVAVKKVKELISA